MEMKDLCIYGKQTKKNEFSKIMKTIFWHFKNGRFDLKMVDLI